MVTVQRSVPAAIPRSKAAAGDRMLLPAATFFVIAVLVHGADHLRRGADNLDADVFWLGTAAIPLEIGVVVLICQRHRLAPLASTAIGFGLAVGYLVVHFLPARSWASDSFTSAVDVSPLSWSAASLEVAAAVVLGVAGLAVLRQRGGLASASVPVEGQLELGRAVRHPLAVTMIAGNALILVVSFAQL